MDKTIDVMILEHHQVEDTDKSYILVRSGQFHDSTFLDECYKAIGCDCVTVARLPLGIDAWVDDMGLLKSNNPCVYLFDIFTGEMAYPTPLAGNIVFSSSNEEGETVSLNNEQLMFIDFLGTQYAGHTR